MMDASHFNEFTPGKVIAGIIGLLLFMGMGLMLSFATGPSMAEYQDAQIEQQKMEFMMDQQRAIEDGMWEARSNITAEDYTQAMSYREY